MGGAEVWLYHSLPLHCMEVSGQLVVPQSHSGRCGEEKNLSLPSSNPGLY
jgi:hypothetical protein